MLDILQPFPLVPTATVPQGPPVTSSYKTVVLQDGSYGTEASTQSVPAPAVASTIRAQLIESPYLASIWINTVIKILFRLQTSPTYLSQKNQVLAALCAFGRMNSTKADGNLQEKIKVALRYLTDAKLFSNLNWLKPVS